MKVFLNGFGIHLFNIKKFAFPVVPFYVGSYKLNKVKSVADFIKEMVIFQFGEISFHRNDSQGKVEAHKVNFEYADYIDKEEKVFRNVYSMASLSKRLKGKAFGAKGSSINNLKLDEGDEEYVKKSHEESTRRLAVGEKNLLDEEAQKDQEEATNIKSAEVVLKRMAELENALSKGYFGYDQGM